MTRLVVITGLPGTGKTTLGRELAKRLSLPFIAKDDIKEILFDGLGWKDREWSQKLGGVTYDVLYHFVELLLRSGTSCVVESNFNPQTANSKFSGLKATYDFEAIQILCWAEGRVVLERFRRRVDSGERHPGHVDATNVEELKKVLLSGRIEALDLAGRIIEVDTTDFEKVNIDDLVRRLN